MKQYISVLLIAFYGVILSHDFIPHHHGTICNVYQLEHTNHHSHNDCNHSNDCSFPFHQHNMDEAGVFVNNANFYIEFECKAALAQVYLTLEEEQLKMPHQFNEFVPYIYKGPDLGSNSLRAPPIS